MATLLRYVRHLRKLNHVGWRVALHQPHLEVTGVKQVVNQLPNLSRSYATNMALNPKPQIKNENITQNIEDLVQRTGRVFTKDLKNLIEEAKSQRHISSLNALTLIRSCGRPLIDANSEKSIKLVHEVMEVLKELNVRMDVSHYNALLDVYLEKDFDFSPEKFLSMLAEKNIEPNRITYRRLIAGYCNKGDIAGATKILEEMKNKDMPLCEDIFISLVKGHSESGDMETAVNTVNVMKSAGIHASADIYSNLMCAYAKRGDLDAINKTLELMKTEDISLLENHYMDIISVLVDNGHMNEAEEFLKKMPKIIRSDTCVVRPLIQLAYKGQFDFAMKILKSTNMDSTRNLFRSALLVKAMVLNGFKVEEIIHVCDIIHKEFNSDKGYSTAIFHVLADGFEHTVAIKLMQKWKETGAEIHEHFFWPLLITHGKSNNLLGMVEVLKHMTEDFNISPSMETLRDYVIRYMPGSVESVFEMLRSLNIPEDNILIATVARLIIARKIRTVANLMATHPSVYPKKDLMHYLANALSFWENTPKSFVAILRYLSDGPEAANPDQVPTSLVDEFINEVTTTIPKNQPQVIKKLLHELVASGLTISPEAGEQFKNYLGSNINDQDLANIEKLTSGKLTIVPIAEYYETPDKPIKLMMSNQIQVEYRKFSELMEKKDVEGIEHTLRTMESSGRCYTWATAQAISLFCEANRVDLAKEYIEKFKTSFPNAKLDLRKGLKFVELLVSNNKFEEAIKFISEQSDEIGPNSYPNQQSDARRILDILASTKNPENVNKMFELFKNKKLIEVDTNILGLTIKVHVVRNDLEKAMEVFEQVCSEYKCTPYRNALAIELIKAEDANNLQKLTDLATELYGESSALLDLAFAFLESGKIRQARKIFETPGLQINNNKIVSAIDHFKRFHPESLNLLVTATKDVARMNRGFIYDKLLDVCIDNNDWQRGLALWMELQDDYVMPTKMFLSKLGNLLKKNNQKVPFVYDNENISESERNPKSNSQAITLSSIAIPVRVGPFEDAIAEQDYAKAVALISTNTPKFEAVGKFMRLINHALENDRVDVALEMTKLSITKYQHAYRSTLLALGDKLTELERIDEIEELGKLMSTTTKDVVGYDKVFCIAKIKIHGLRNFMNSFKIPEHQSEEGIREIQRTVHFGMLVKGLLKDDSCLNEFEDWVEKLAAKGVSRGKHALWCYYFIKNDPKAETLWEKEIVKASSPLSKPIKDYAVQNKDVKLMEKLMEKFESHPKLSLNISKRSFADLMEFYNSIEHYDDSLKVFNRVIQNYRANVLPTRVVLDLKEGLERNGKQFPYKIQYKDARSRTDRRTNSQSQEDESRAEENLSI